MARLFQYGLAIATLTSVALGACPNKCSGHGTCGANDVCDCTQNWINSDCSGRLCPYSRAWHDTARNSEDAHYYAECGNRGTCDRSTGICQCDNDFEGSGCRRLRCPDSCSGHGRCLFVEELATLESDYRVDGDVDTTYSLWEREKVQGCQCDAGWEGHNCNSRVCPKGDDPLTVISESYSIPQRDMTQGLVLSGGSAKSFFLRYHDPYGATWTTDKIDVLATDTSVQLCPKVESALLRLPNFALNSQSLAVLGHANLNVAGGNLLPITRDPQNIDKATVGTAVNNNGATTIVCLITFPSGPGTTGLQPLLECDKTSYTAAGSQPKSAGITTCDVKEHYDYGTGTAPALNDIVTVPMNELATCSNRGLCNGESGECVCYAGHTGLACELQEALV